MMDSAEPGSVVAKRLAAIGSYSATSIDMGSRYTRLILWEEHKDLPAHEYPLRERVDYFHLLFSMEGPVLQDLIPDDPMFELWHRYRKQHRSHFQELMKQLVARVREEPCAYDGDLCGDFPDGFPDQTLLGLMDEVTIHVQRVEHNGQTDYSVIAKFQLARYEFETNLKLA